MKFCGLFYSKLLKFALADKETNRISLIKFMSIAEKSESDL